MKISERTFNCCEQYMMYRKAILFDDFETAKKIMDAEYPRDQKQLGREVKNFDKEIWEKVCRDIVFQGNLCKFGQNAELKKMMLETEDRKFVEASPSDRIWGIGLDEDDSRIYNPEEWQGTNWLGEALDKVKETLKKQIWD